MAGEKRFGSSLFGFKKADVNYYIEKILKEFDDRLKQKDSEIDDLKHQNRELKAKYDELYKKIDQVNQDRAKIAEVLIKANEKAELIIEDARKQALEEKHELDDMIEKEKEMLVDIKQHIKTLKNEVVVTLKKYENQLGSIAGSDDAEKEAAVSAEE